DVFLHGDQIEVTVTDRGHGLTDPERLFEPFFSTKSEGLGMGLNICRTIIESHHGRLWATTNPQGGTIFRFTLPCATSGTTQPNHQSEELHA
ncbi:MAG: ATP-binding protein, partial [Burkholderiales bacterium]